MRPISICINESENTLKTFFGLESRHDISKRVPKVVKEVGTFSQENFDILNEIKPSCKKLYNKQEATVFESFIT